MMSIQVHNQFHIKHQYHTLPTQDSQEEIHKGSQDHLLRNGKLKNQLCRNYLKYGYCRYNDKCQFAHGVQELRQNCGVNMKYKTKICQSYLFKGCCQYGERCNFVHRFESQNSNENRNQKMQKNQKQKWRIMKSNFRDIIEEARQKSRFF